MRVVLVIFVCCVANIQATFSQMRRYAMQNPLRIRHVAALRTNNPKQPLGPIHFHGVIGKLPSKYTPLAKPDEFASSKLLTAIPEILSKFPSDYKVGSLGPINVDLPEFWLRGKLYLNNLSVKGINLATLKQLELRVKSNRADFVAHATRISADVNFEFEGHIGVVPLFLTGTVNVKVQDLHPSGAVSFKKVKLAAVGEVFQAEAADISVEIKDLGINIKNGNTNEFEQDIESIKAKVLDDIKDEVADIAVGVALKEVNKELAKVPAAELMAFITKAH